MDELTFLLILAGIGIVLLVAMFTYYRHHKKIHDEIQDFNRHHDLDDVLLHEEKNHNHNDILTEEELPSSFYSTQHDNFDIDNVFNKSRTEKAKHTATSPVSSHAEHVDSELSGKDNFIPASRSEKPEVPFAQAEPDRAADITAAVPPPVNADSGASEIGRPEIHPEVSTDKDEKQTQAPTRQQRQPQVRPPAQNIEVIYEPLPKDVNDLILSFTIVSRGNKFIGPHLIKALQDSGLRFGEMNIFHYPGDKNPTTYALFSVANLVEPGTFNLHEIEHFSTPGISLFMRLPTRKSAFDAFDEFLRVSRLLSQKLGGELCDEARNQLTQQSISHKKEQIKKLQFELTKAKKIAEMSK